MNFRIQFVPPRGQLIINMPSLSVGIELIRKFDLTQDQVLYLHDRVTSFQQDDYFLCFNYNEALNESFFKDKNFGIVKVSSEFFNQFVELRLEQDESYYEIQYELNTHKIYQAWQDAGKPLTWEN